MVDIKLSLILIIIGVSITSIAVLFFIFIFDETTGSTVDFAWTRILMSTKQPNNKYILALETCAGNEKLNQPSIFIASDLEEKVIRVSKDILPNKCFVTGTIIRTLDPNTISFSTVSTEKYFSESSLKEQEIQRLLDTLQLKNQELSNLIQSPDSPEFDTKFSKIVNDISELRKQLKRVKTL